MKILVLNGPNLNLLGERDTLHYGSKTLAQVEEEVADAAGRLGVEVEFYQSNHEGDLIDEIHRKRKEVSGIIINPGALTHYSYALRDALEAVRRPVVEVHISDIEKREEWRRVSVIRDVVVKAIVGHGTDGYSEALEGLTVYISGIEEDS